MLPNLSQQFEEGHIRMCWWGVHKLLAVYCRFKVTHTQTRTIPRTRTSLFLDLHLNTCYVYQTFFAKHVLHNILHTSGFYSQQSYCSTTCNHICILYSSLFHLYGQFCIINFYIIWFEILYFYIYSIILYLYIFIHIDSVHFTWLQIINRRLRSLSFYWILALCWTKMKIKHANIKFLVHKLIQGNTWKYISIWNFVNTLFFFLKYLD